MIHLIEELGSAYDIEGLVSLLTGTATLCGELPARLVGHGGVRVQQMLQMVAV